MSTRTVPNSIATSLEGSTTTLFRTLALAGVLVLLAAIVFTLSEITRTVGGTQSLYLLVLTMVIAATILAHAIRPRTALAIGLGATAIGFLYYLEAAGYNPGAAAAQADKFISDTITLATGMPLIQMLEAGIWTLGFAPAPVFLTWYLAMRERYVLSVVPGGVALLFLVLTTDAGIGVTLVGVVGGIAAVGFGELDRHEGSIAQADVLAIMFAIIVFLSMTITFVPGGAASPTFLLESEPGTLDGAVDSDPDRSTITGSVDLSPEVHFTVVTEEPSYWRTGVYDRYTGDSWVRSGPDAPYDDVGLPEPDGEYETAKHTITIERQFGVMPVATNPTALDGDVTAHTRVSDHGQPMPDGPLIAGDTYNVESAVLEADPTTLNEAGTEYPEPITEYYLQMPESRSDEFAARTDEIIAESDAETPYEKAAAIERYFQDGYDYTLEVDRPGGNAAEEFLLEMDEGYCVYFATTMTQMLRSEGIPARYATGYTTGQQVDDNEYVVRGLDAHAWVEVYFPDQGWVVFEPTPSSSRDATHQERLEQAREDNESGVDTDQSEDVPVDGPEENESVPDVDGDIDDLLDPNDTSDDPSGNETNDTNDTNDTPGGPGGPQDPLQPGNPSEDGTGGTGGVDSTDEDEEDLIPFAPGDLLVGVALLIGLAAGGHRAGVGSLVSREVSRYWHGFRSDPTEDTVRAYERLELVLARRFRPRKRGESRRQYVDSLERVGLTDPRARRVLECYERAHYGGGVDEATADEAVSLVTALARERAPLVGRLWR
ncbi:transglutaminase TgpA family protein [Natronosalvus halobius]|uniref:transglutaminase TgpA family protein n=1 Tax=Natronosalvus halobius TaxID=2953746 RepID=UPI00209D7844|nr:transglutaminaseTgpA domain-containing protein [Natronosalvus halobius]USZ70506.1 transglutaminaseTgpA domain-containing protein [Natronosalvus halobius]